MSSDLWAAFASSSEDPTSNPWAQIEDKEIGKASSSRNVGRAQDHLSLRGFDESLPESSEPWSSSVGPGFQSLDSWPIKASIQNAPTCEVDDDEDFGEFEESEPHLAPNAWDRSAATDKSRELTGPSQSGQISPTSPSLDPFANLDRLSKAPVTAIKSNAPRQATTQAQRNRPRPALVEELLPYTEEEWGEFSPEPQEVSSIIRTPIALEDSTLSQQLTSKESRGRQTLPRARETPRKLPPTNVPPPSILINLVTTLVQGFPERLDLVGKDRETPKDASTAPEESLQSCLASLRVAARIIAGRKLRWKRDHHLVQCMSIGQAGRAGGMKLTGVDKAETLRENRETAEFVRVWKQQLGALRNALVTVKGNAPGLPLALPNVSETMAVRMLKPEEGATTSRRCCFLCGLKREERVSKVDQDVWDSFEEFWVETWGHSECQAFWEGHERSLVGLR